MPSYKSNVKAVISRIKWDLEQGVKRAIENSLREATIDVTSSNLHRIHNEGKAVDGSNIGNYVEGPYKKKRSKKGKRIDTVNLSYSGKLSKEYAALKISSNLYAIGFLTSYGSELAGYIEENYGQKIWGKTPGDEAIVRAIFDRNLKKELKGLTIK